MSMPVRTAVLGLGGRGRYFCRMYAESPRSRLVAVCDRNPQAFGPVRNKWGNEIDYFTDSAEMLQSEDIDAVIVATHDKDHAESAVKVLRHDKHCFLEKPMAQSIEDCDAIIQAAEDSQGLLMVGYELRHCVLFEEMRRLLDRGDIGDVKMAWAVDNVSVGGNYFYHDAYRRRDYVYSLLLQKGCHTIDLLNWFVGGHPVKVYAATGLDVFGGDVPNDKRCRSCEDRETCPYFIDYRRFVMDYGAEVRRDDFCVYAEEVDVPDNGMALIEYDNGVRATFTECHFTPEYTREFWLVGDKAKMYGFYNNECEFVIRVQERHTREVTEYRPESPGGGHGGGDPRIQEHFLDCIATGERPLATAIAGRDSAAIAIAAEESAHTGMPFKIPQCPVRLEG